MFDFNPEKGIPVFEEEQKKFTNEIAEACSSELTDEDKKALLDNPDPIDHHFGYGMHTRNRYLHNKKLGFLAFDKDKLSAQIVEEIVKRLQEGTDRWHANQSN